MSNSRDLKSEDFSFPTPRDRATPPSPREKAMTPPLHQIDPHTGEAKLSLGLLQKSVIIVVLHCLVISICYFYMLKAAWVKIKRTTEKKACSVNRDEAVTQLKKVPLSLLVDVSVTATVWNWQAGVPSCTSQCNPSWLANWMELPVTSDWQFAYRLS